MIIDSKGREIKLPIGDLKGTVCIAYRSCIGFFFKLEGMFSQILDPTNAKVAAPQLLLILN